MSSSPESAESVSDSQRASYQDAWTSIYELVDSGKSWSGSERNCCFLNTGGGRFADVSSASGLDFSDDGRGVAITDWDFDGKLDIWTSNRTAPRVRLLRNVSRLPSRRSLFLKLEGVHGNRDALGARVELRLHGERTMIRTVHAGDGYISQSSKWLHFGLGENSVVAGFAVRWPGGRVESFQGVEADTRTRFILKEGTGKAEPQATPKLMQASADETPGHQDAALEGEAAGDPARTFFVGRVPMPDASFHPWTEEARTLASFHGMPLLVNLWSDTCAACLAELKEWSDAESALSGSGLRILALNVDEASAEQDAAAQARLQKAGFSFDSGRAAADLVNAMEIVNRAFLERRERLPVPTSFLLDATGNVAAIYKGRVPVPLLLRDVGLLEAGAKERRAAAVPFPGRWSALPLPPDPSPVLGTFVMARQSDAALAYAERCLASTPLLREADDALEADLLRVKGDLLLDRNEIEKAVETYARLVASAPGNAALHREVGQQLLSRQRAAEALRHLELAVQLLPQDAELKLNVAMLQMRAGRFAQALPHLRELAAARPELAPLQSQLARALQQTGDVRSAIAAYRIALRLDPKDSESAAQLAWLLSTSADPALRDGEEALPIAQALCEGEGARQPGRLALLAAAHAARGDFSTATSTASRARDLAAAAGNRPMADAIAAQLERYHASLPAEP